MIAKKWLEDEDIWLKENYPKFGVVKCCEYLGRTRDSVYRRAQRLKLKAPSKRVFKQRKLYNTQEIIDFYLQCKNQTTTAKRFGLAITTVRIILNKMGVKTVRFSLFDEIKEPLLKDFNGNELSMRDIAKKYNYSLDQIREKLIEHGLYDETRWTRFINKKPYYECWAEKYGKEIADKKLVEYTNKLKFVAKKGAESHRYNKPPSQGSGNGWKGWYRDFFFRSLRELSAILAFEEAGIEWETGENKDYYIKYEFMGKTRTYRPDFIIDKEMIEVKPERLHNSQLVLAKKEAAERYCAENGFTYVLTDVEINPVLIKEHFDAGYIKFNGNYEQKFLEYWAI